MKNALGAGISFAEWRAMTPRDWWRVVEALNEANGAVKAPTRDEYEALKSRYPDQPIS